MKSNISCLISLTFIKDGLVCVLSHLLRQTVKQNMSRLITSATARRIPKELIQSSRLTLERKNEIGKGKNWRPMTQQSKKKSKWLPNRWRDYTAVYQPSIGRHLNRPTGGPVTDRSVAYTETNSGGIFGSKRPQPKKRKKKWSEKV